MNTEALIALMLEKTEKHFEENGRYSKQTGMIEFVYSYYLHLFQAKLL
jgi:hypothetical protein